MAVRPPEAYCFHARVTCITIRAQSPFRHIAEILLKKSEEVGESKGGGRASIGGGDKKAGFASGTPRARAAAASDNM